MAEKVIKKKLNRDGYTEYIVRDLEAMNDLLAGADCRMMTADRHGLWAELNMLPYQATFSFFLLRDLADDEVVDLIDTRLPKNKGRGFYTYYFSPVVGEVKCDYEVAGAFCYYNPKTEGRVLENIYCYDVNKAYLAVLADGVYPNTNKPLGAGVVAEGEIGFRLTKKVDRKKKEYTEISGVARTGEWAEERFPKAVSPLLKEFAKKKGDDMEKLKKEGKKEELTVMKLAVNIAIGISRNHNAWFYEYVVGTCGNRMRELMNEDTILCNTDSIFSLTKREDLPIGTKLGQFKVEYDGVSMVHNGTNYVVFSGEEYLSMKQKGKLKELQDPKNFVEQAHKQTIEPKYKLIDYGKRGAQIYES